MFAPTFGFTIDQDEKLFRRVQPSEVLSCLGYPTVAVLHSERSKFMSFMSDMDFMRCVYFYITYFVPFPSPKESVTARPHSGDLKDCFTVEIKEDVEQDRSLKPSLAYSLPSHSEWKAACSSDHDVLLYIWFLSDRALDPKKQPGLDVRYKTLLVEQSLERDNSILFFTAFPQKQALIRDIQVCVISLKLCSVLFAAYHASAGNVHASFKASLWKLCLRFY
jgi:hypothetical protein